MGDCELRIPARLANQKNKTNPILAGRGSESYLLSTPIHKYDNVLFGLECRAWLWHCRIRCLLMPRTSPYAIRLSSAELTQLEKRAGKYTLPYFQVQRAKMILLAAEGLTNDQIAARLDTRLERVAHEAEHSPGKSRVTEKKIR